MAPAGRDNDNAQMAQTSHAAGIPLPFLGAHHFLGQAAACFRPHEAGLAMTASETGHMVR